MLLLNNNKEPDSVLKNDHPCSGCPRDSRVDPMTARTSTFVPLSNLTKAAVSPPASRLHLPAPRSDACAPGCGVRRCLASLPPGLGVDEGDEVPVPNGRATGRSIPSRGSTAFSFVRLPARGSCAGRLRAPHSLRPSATDLLDLTARFEVLLDRHDVPTNRRLGREGTPIELRWASVVRFVGSRELVRHPSCATSADLRELESRPKPQSAPVTIQLILRTARHPAHKSRTGDPGEPPAVDSEESGRNVTLSLAPECRSGCRPSTRGRCRTCRTCPTRRAPTRRRSSMPDDSRSRHGA